MQIPETPWEKAREGNALSVQELGISAAMANFVPLSRTCSGPSIPWLKTHPVARQHQAGQAAELSPSIC